MCKFPKFSSVLKVGLGSPQTDYATQWEDMITEKVGGSEYRWSMNLQTSPDKSRKRTQFVWKRTQHVTVDGVSASKLSSRNFKLLDDSGNIVAVFTSDRTYRKCGKLQVNVDYGQDFDTMVFITCLGLFICILLHIVRYQAVTDDERRCTYDICVSTLCTGR
ncbi:predicted protein [Aspergillus terreus NIH2624]|uniref:Uncharacterized protein n=1 Tax=Aspergillus terreus (strain NIH 2624 / FGSC A1156) TaxID=341663 RepID=Q0CD27_ASPTN|nr:uncharacterized protein ATEG_08407 [Aspergillus terreus NIH2624]EAU31580.1 predicted protein [Aspergillus terreus NIH2624]